MVNSLMTHSFQVRKIFAYETYSENIGLYLKSKQLPLTEKMYLFNNAICQIRL